MKKLFIFSVVSIFLSSTYFANAQSSVDGGIILMPQFTGLLNIQDFAAGNDLNYKLTTGFAGGLSCAYNFNNHIGIELNLLISSQGEKYTGNLSYYKPNGADTVSYASRIVEQASLVGNTTTSTAENPYVAEVSLTYFKIPILLKLTSNSEKSAFFYFNVWKYSYIYICNTYF
jgi:hypothetical protein